MHAFAVILSFVQPLIFKELKEMD